MNLDERQRAMLLEMGIRVWSPPAESSPAPAGPAVPDPAGQDNAPRNVASYPVFIRPGARLDAKNPGLAISPVDAVPGEAAPLDAVAPGVTTAAVAPAASDAHPAPRRSGAVSDPDAPPALAWSALVQAVSGCRACGLCEGRQAALVAAQCPPLADWLVVGEMPDEDEERAGLPFVGAPGVLLDNMLRALGLRRTSAPVEPGAGPGPAGLAHVTLAARCRPGLPRSPLPAELATCEGHLQREIAQVRPRVILALGRFAAQALLQQEQPALAREPLGRLRGRDLSYQGLPLVVSYPPAYLMRNPADKARAWQDLCRARARLRHPS
ncbi:MAG: uracil-DNA glycosylase [Rhodoferax sp.]|nr:uracil-DNA glycosylase [Rhodoferax sp.]